MPPGGAGSHFAQITAAIAAASPGDLIVVRPGRYLAFVIDKGVSLVGENRASVVVEGGFRVDGVPAGPPAVVRSLSTTLTLGTTLGLHVVDCGAHVHIEEVTSSPVFIGNDIVTVRDCRLVTFNSCDIQGKSEVMQIIRSAVHLDDSQITGLAGQHPALGGPPTGYALQCIDATVHIGGGLVQGGDVYPPFLTIPTEGIHLVSGTLVLGPPLTVRAGVGSKPVPAIRTDGGTVLYDPGVALQPSSGSPPITGGASVRVRSVPVVQSFGGAPGGVLTGVSIAPAGSVIATLAGIGAPPISTPFGALWLDETPLAVVDAGTIPAGGQRLFVVPVPGTVPSGSPLTLQSIAVVGGRVYLSTPSTAVVGR